MCKPQNIFLATGFFNYRDSERVYTIALIVIAAPIGAHQGEHLKVEAEHANICADMVSKKKDKKHFLGLFFYHCCTFGQ